MEKNENFLKKDIMEEDLGFLLWQLGELENFYPCYRTMIQKEEK